MGSFVHRLASGVRVSWASSPSFATVGTVLSALLVLPLLTGVIVPLALCPGWLRSASRLVPMSGALAALDAPSAEVPALVGRDVLVGALWAVVGLAATRHAVIRLRRGLRRDPV